VRDRWNDHVEDAYYTREGRTMTEVLDMHGNTIRVGARVLDENGQPDGTVTEITDPDGDTNSYGQQVGINPTVLVKYDDGVEERWTTRWNATGPWDDYRDDYTCDDLEVAVDEHGQGVNLSAVERLERLAQREPDGQRMQGGRIVPTDR
jgi:hypothetical protein